MNAESETSLDDAWARLERLVDWSTDFYLAFVFCASAEAAALLRERSRAVLEKSGRRMRVFHPEKPADVLATVAAIAQPESKKSQCFWLDSVDADAADPTYNLWREGYDQLILRLNESRQGLRTHLGGGLVLALPYWYKSLVAPAASDLWSIRSLTIDLPGIPAKTPLPSVDMADFVLPPVRLDEGPTLDPDQCKDQARRLATRGEGARPAMIANLLRAAEGYLDRDRARESLGMAEEAEQLLRGVAPNLLGPDHAAALVAMAAAEEALGEWDAASEHIARAIELRHGNMERDTLHVYAIAERIALGREDVRAARDAAEGALVVANARHAEHPEDVEAKNDLLGILDRVGPLRRALGDVQGARGAADQALELRGGVEESSMTRIEALRPSAQLPAIWERLPAGEDGEKEFERLVKVVFPRVPAHSRMNADGPRVLWAPEDIRSEEQILRRFVQKTLSTRGGEGELSVTERSRVTLVLPRDPTTDEIEWLRTMTLNLPIDFDVWGMSHLEKLLRPVPALFARYYPELAAGHLPNFVPFDFRAFARHYCDDIVHENQYVHLLGFPPDALREKDAKAHIRLADLFVPTVFREQQDRDNRPAIAALLKDERSVLVLGDPGMGKTMLLTFLALLHANGAANLAGYVPPPRRIPLFVSLREYALEDQAHGTSLVEWIAKRCARHSELRHAHPAFFEASLRMGEAIVLLDGLDEVGLSAARRRMAERVRELRRDFPDCPVWVTSRIHGYTHDIALPPEEFEHVLIGALDDAQVDDILVRWYEIQVPNDTEKRAESKNSLRQAIFRTKQVRALAGNPLLLTLMAFVHRFLGHLPQDRGELYEQCVNMLLRSWLEARERPEKHAFEHLGLATELPRGYLEALAFHVQERGLLADDESSGARGLFSRDDALAFLTTHHLENDRRDPSVSPLKAREEMREFIDYACDRVGLLVDRGGGKLSFLHLSFQEYLAASCDTVMTNIRDQEALFVGHFRDPAWSEVLLLRLYLFARKRDRAGLVMFDELVRVLLDELGRGDSVTGWLLLGRALRDRHDVRPSQRRVILERLVRAWAIEAAFEGDVFVVLEDIHVFATDVVRDELRAACAQVQSSGSPAEAVAALYLEEKLFGGVDDAAKQMGARGDVDALLPDLVAFMDVPGFVELLERATADHWEAAFGALNGEDVHRLTLTWATGVVPCPVRSDAPLLGATRWLRRKINAEVDSREAFARTYAGAPYAALFERPGTLILKGNDHEIKAPLSFAANMSSQAVSLPRHNAICLTQRNLGIDRFLSVQSATPVAEPLKKFLARFIRRWISQIGHADMTNLSPDRPHPPSPPLQLRGYAARGEGGVGKSFAARREEEPELVADAFVWDFVSDFGRNFDCTFVRNFVQIFGREFSIGLSSYFQSHFHHRFGPLFICTFVREFVKPVVEYFNLKLSSLIPNEHERCSAEADLPGFVAQIDRPTRRLSCSLSIPNHIPILLADIGSVASITWFLSLGRHLQAHFPNGVFPDDAWKAWFAQNPVSAFWSALAWNEHAKLFQQNHAKLDGALGALMLAHADYASLMTGLDLEDATDYSSWKTLVDAAGPAHVDTLRHFASAPADLTPPTPLSNSASLRGEGGAGKTRVPPAPSPLFTYLHLSDMHFGLPNAGDRHNQSIVLAAFRDEFANLTRKGLPQPDVVFITGDIAWAGKTSDYDDASAWLDEVLKTLNLTADRVFVVPGNHDLDRDVDADRNVKRLMRLLRDGDDVDEALADAGDRDLLLRRKDAYLAFAKRFAPACHHPDKSPLERLAWTYREQARGDLAVHVVGFDTALLAAGNDDAKKLRLGQAQIALLNDCAPDREFVVVLGHHPFNGEWLHPDDERDATTQVRRRAHVYLSGHVHDHDSAQVISGGGNELLRVVAGAMYGGRPKDIPQGHAYNVGAVMPPFEGKPIRLRVHPRRFSFKQGDFRTDTDNVPDGQTFAEFPLHRLRV